MRRSLHLLMMSAALVLLLGQPGVALAKGVTTIHDGAGVLTAADQQSIRDAAARASFVVAVATVNGGYAGTSGGPDKTGFRQAIDGMVRNDVVIGLDPADRLDHIAAATNTGLTATALTNAKAAAKSSFSASRWGQGIVLAIQSLTQAAGTSSQGAPAAQPASGGFPWAGLVLLLVVVGAIILVVVMLTRRRAARPPVYGPGFSPTGVPGQGPYPPGYNYPPGYYPPGQPGGGLGGNILAGGLGALGGGLLGYELGKQAGEHESQQPEGGYYQPEGGGIVDSDDGGAGADFGDFGGGGDSGGGDF